MKEESRKQLEQAIAKDYSNITGVLVQQNGQKVYEQYFNGAGPETAFHVFSVTKSILSILIGIAVDQGKIGSVEEKVLSFFPDYTPKRGEKTAQQVAIRDMLTMTTPFKYRFAPYTKYFSSDSWVKTALDLMGGRGKIGTFRYLPLIGPDILSGILTKATGKSALAFAQETLFGPLGIDVSQNIVFGSKEEQMDIMKNRREHGWVADPQGINTAGWGLFLTPADMVKIGQLYLDKGCWNGEQVVSSSWVKESTRTQARWDERRYGYLWWVIDEKEHSFAALGDGGNAIYVNPEKSLVVAITGSFQPRVKDRVELIKKYIEPAL
jgi:CubicO group peptidase (beta-lactamase class C family)